MRLVKRIGSLTVAVTALCAQPASAGLDSEDHIATFEVQVAVAGELEDGFVNVNPCASNAPFTEFTFRALSQVKSGDVSYSFDAVAGATPESVSPGWFVSGSEYADFYGVIDLATFERVTITHRRYLVGCARPDAPDEFDASTVSPVWVPVVTEISLVPAVLAELTRLVPAPETFFPVADPVYGWLYVQAPMEVRVANLEVVSATVTAANAVSSASASAVATPVEVVFEPGEPGGAPVVCPLAAVEAGWDRGDPDGSGCVYTYRNSSAITPSREFGSRTRVRWHVTGSGGLDMVIETLAFDPVQVAEIQAVVVAP